MDFQKQIERIPYLLRNRYSLVLIAYLVYMLFLDTHNFRSQWKLKKNLKALENQETYYSQQIEHLIGNYTTLFSNYENMEQYAREKYWMKKENEDLFIIEEEY